MTPTFIELVTTPDLSASGPALTGMTPSGEVSGTQAPGQGDGTGDFISQLSRMMAGGATEAGPSSVPAENQDPAQNAPVLNDALDEGGLEELAQESVTAGGAEVLSEIQDGERLNPQIEEAPEAADEELADPGLVQQASMPVEPETPSLALGHGAMTENVSEPALGKEENTVAVKSKEAAPFLPKADSQNVLGGSKADEPGQAPSSAQGGATDSSASTAAKPETEKIETVLAQASETAEAKTGLADETAKSSRVDGETAAIKDLPQRLGTQSRSHEKGAQGESSSFAQDPDAPVVEENASAFSMDAAEEEGLIKPEMAARRAAATQAHGVQSPAEAKSGDGDAPASGVGTHQAAEKSAPESASIRQAVAPRPMTGDVVNQLADRAVFLQRNGQSEVRMDLKPEYLGRIQMKVATENHRVTVHLLAETPMAREIIEANLGQLRSDLANQGLNVDQIEVAMFASGDRDSQGAGNPNQGGEGRMPGGAMKTAAVEGTQEAPSGIAEQAAGSGNRSVDYFA